VKTIALERGLEELKQALEERGYHTVYADAMDAPVSVYIYQEQHTLDQESFHSSLNNSMVSGPDQSGILLIHAKDTPVDQIIAMIENRLYSPLFYY
jgi:hypothetical protein